MITQKKEENKYEYGSSGDCNGIIAVHCIGNNLFANFLSI